MAKVAKKVQLKIVEYVPEAPVFELVNVEVSEARAKAIVQQYQAAYKGIAGIEIKYGKVAA